MLIHIPQKEEATMSYSAEVSRTNPSCFVFLVDQSGSMTDPFGAGDSNHRKADEVADAINRLLQNLVIRCAKAEGVRDYYHIAVIGYGASVGPGFAGVLAGKDLVPISEVALHPARVETRTKKISDGAGGLVDQEVKFPIWFDPKAEDGTPMAEALRRADAILSAWLAEHRGCFPPILINITDGEPNPGDDPALVAETLKSRSSDDGNVLLFNLHLSSQRTQPVEFPDTEQGLPDQYARNLFGMSSVLPQHMYEAARAEGYRVTPDSRGFVFNAGIEAVVKFLDIGTRPSNLR
jgi:hypothetical protein